MNSSDLYTEGGYLEKNPTWGEEDSAWKAQQVYRMIKNSSLQLKNICEVGCGAGEILNLLHGLLPDDISFVGYDISPQAYEMCLPRSKDRLQYFLGDFLKDNEKKFDLLLVLDVFEHVEDYIGFLRKIRDKATYKIFHIPLDISVQRVLLSKPILKRRKDLGHIHYFTKELALESLLDTGYEIKDYFYTSSTLDFPAASPMYALGRLPLRILAKVNPDIAVRILGGHSLMVLAK